MGVPGRDTSKSGVGGRSNRISLGRWHLTGDHRNVEELARCREKMEKIF